MEQTLALNSSFGTVGGASVAGSWPNYDWYQPAIYYPMIERHYHSYPVYTYWNEPSKIEQAFKIAQLLIDKKKISPKTVKDFIDLINDLVSIL